MKSFCITLFALFFAYAFTVDYVPYEGFRVDLSALTLNRDILGIIIPGLNKTYHHVFNNYEESGSFGTVLKIHDIKITYYKINEERLNITGYEYQYPIYRLKGLFESIYFHLEFLYTVTWLGITVDKGTGKAAVTNLNNEILVLFNETDPDVKITHPWDIVNITLTGTLYRPSSWIKTIMHKEFIHEFDKVVDKSLDNFAHELLKTYRYIEDKFPDDNIDLIFRNDILSVTPTVGGKYLSIAFKTNMTVNGYVHKKMYRKVNSTVIPQSNFDICMNAELVPDVMDIMGKGGYHDREVDPRQWSFNSDEMREVFNILPNLEEKYNPTDKFIITCQCSRFETVNDMTQRQLLEPLLELQNPIYCMFRALKDDNFFLIVDIFFREYYELKNKQDVFYGHVRSIGMKDYRTTPSLPENRKQILTEHVISYMYTFFDTELLSPGLRVIPNRHNEVVYQWGYLKEEEICFYYKENRTISAN